MKKNPLKDCQVKAAYDAFPEKDRALLLLLRDMIFACAAETEGVGKIEETLKWGEPAYLTVHPKSGTTIRLGISKSGKAAIFTHCQTSVMSDFRALFPDDFTFEGNRVVNVNDLTEETQHKLRLLISSALTYHIKK